MIDPLIAARRRPVEDIQLKNDVGTSSQEPTILIIAKEEVFFLCKRMLMAGFVDLDRLAPTTRSCVAIELEKPVGWRPFGMSCFQPLSICSSWGRQNRHTKQRFYKNDFIPTTI